MVHTNMPCLNLGTCSVICVWMCLNLGISSILKQNNENLQAFFDKSLDDVLPKFRQRAEYLQDFLLTFLHFAEDFAQNVLQHTLTISHTDYKPHSLCRGCRDSL